MNVQVGKRIAAIAADRQSGASQLLAEAIAVLREALESGEDVREVGEALRAAQPSMAPLWNAAAAAEASAREPAAFERFVRRVARAPRAIVRFAVDTLGTGIAAEAPLAIVTISYSGTVAQVLEALARTRPMSVACSEGRPAMEGRQLAVRLAGTGIAVTCFTDAAIGHGLDGASAVLLGADAISPDWFLNKSGTRMLAAAAAGAGVPVYLLAGREKLVGRDLAARLGLRGGAPAEVWPDPPPGIHVRNPYFERTPLDLVSSLITDIGLLGVDAVASVVADR